jgi:phytanoyl-CoA hydroxylase
MIVHARPETGLSQDRIDAFHRDGYLPAIPMLEEPEIEILRAEYDRVFAEARASRTYRNLAVSDGTDAASDGAAPQQMLQIRQMCERSLAFRRLLYDDRILDVVRALIGPNLMLFHDQALWKPAHTGGAVFWHQDNAYWRCRPANLVSCWLTLDDVVRENGAMQVIPGSHLAPCHHASTESTNRLLDTEVDESRAVVVPASAGSGMFHHCQTLHYTAPNITDRQRRAFAIHYMPVGTSDREGHVLSANYARPVVSLSM